MDFTNDIAVSLAGDNLISGGDYCEEAESGIVYRSHPWHDCREEASRHYRRIMQLECLFAAFELSGSLVDAACAADRFGATVCSLTSGLAAL